MIALLVGLAYYVLARIGLHFRDARTGVTPLWPAVGFAFGVFVVSPRSRWPLLTLAVFIASAIAEIEVAAGAVQGLLLAGVNALTPWLAALAVQSAGGRRRVSFDTAREACGLLAAVLIVNALASALDALILTLTGGDGVGATFAPLWLASGAAMVVVAPVVVAAGRPRAGDCNRLETAAMFGVTAVLAGLMFSHLGYGWVPLSRFAFLLLPILLWVALRGGSRVVAAFVLLVAVIAARGTAHGVGPFAYAATDQAQAIRVLEAFLLVAAWTTLLVAAIMAERRGAEARLIQREAQLAALNERLVEDARRDPLTGLRNRRALSDDARGLDALTRSGGAFALALCDVDRFKAYNDRLGHLAGDHILRAIAGIVAGALREGDVAYRYGGEELLLVLRDAGQREAMAVAERVRAAVAAAALPHPDGIDGRFTVSVGVAAGGESYGALLAGADAALYEAKNAGRDRVVAAAGSEFLTARIRQPAITEEPVPRHLQSMLRLSRAAVTGGSINDVAEVLAQTIRSELSFRVVAVNLLDDERRELSVAAVLGEPEARETLLGARYDWSDWEPMMGPEHQRCGAVWLPAESYRWEPSGPTWTPSVPSSLGADAWGPEDSLLLPLRGAEGDILGVVSVDQPLSGRRPDDAELTVLMAVADHAALVLEQVRLSTAQSVALREQTQELRLAAVLLLAETIDLRHPSTAEHSRTVGAHARATAAALGLEPERVERIHAAGVLHDLGKLGISDSILAKPTAPDDAEWDEIRRHPSTGARILENAGLDDIAAWVRAHHERIDGVGYPERLNRREIPLEARILAVADAFEAMTADRPYHAGISRDAACQELCRCAGTQFDAAVVDAFLSTLERRSGPEDGHVERAA